MTGDAANVAARLETSAQSGQILIGEPTHQLVSAAVEPEPVEPFTVKGKAEPLRAWRLRAVLPGAVARGRAQRAGGTQASPTSSWSRLALGPPPQSNRRSLERAEATGRGLARPRARPAAAACRRADRPSDYIQVESVLELLRSLAESGRIVVVAAHDERLIPLADRVVAMSPRTLAREDETTPVELATGQFLFRQGDPGDLIYTGKDGQIEIVRERADGLEGVLARIPPATSSASWRRSSGPGGPRAPAPSRPPGWSG